MVTVNQIKDKIKDLITEKGKNANLEKVSYTKEKLDRDKNKQSDLTADEVEKILDTEKNTEKRKEVLADFQDNLVKKLEKKGVILTDEEED
jgi:isopentenyl diphosphate isomerase/L-lactate dehydrogenase-like FMN-dependent dehydrogenase